MAKPQRYFSHWLAERFRANNEAVNQGDPIPPSRSLGASEEYSPTYAHGLSDIKSTSSAFRGTSECVQHNADVGGTFGYLDCDIQHTFHIGLGMERARGRNYLPLTGGNSAPVIWSAELMENLSDGMEPMTHQAGIDNITAILVRDPQPTARFHSTRSIFEDGPHFVSEVENEQVVKHPAAIERWPVVMWRADHFMLWLSSVSSYLTRSTLDLGSSTFLEFLH
ncbi:uncharacterized protein EDB91DRAFT_1078440 [Suillus paluster]|uniref:uncharacterized protein n=1 Tax=Suillus paluster TaxID=48578 RepID=UPI001B869909|nr:uncharacterized protein EDB91DRAFT_1078440 [Suillus paluster]KAG1750395.1 hypothetical protein EDB91DRAFT_1078440 [Suillus paluster]